MNYSNITKNAKHVGRVTKRFLHKHGHKIATAMSTVATIGGTVWACKKTLKVHPVVLQYRNDRELMKDDKAALRKSYINEAGYLAKEFAGPVAALTAGEVLKVGAVVSLENTVAELTVGIAALQTQINDMKKDVIKKMGEEKADKLLRGERELDETCEQNIYLSKIKGLSPYAVIFDESHPWWQEDPLYRYKNFYQMQCHFNDLLFARASASDVKRKRPVLMNEIYEELQYPDTELGSHAGYWFDPKNHPEVDNVITFIFVDPVTGKRINEFPNGIDRPVYIDFNVDYGYATQFLEVC